MNEPKLYTKNAKKHPDKQLKQIANSLREFGWRQPIVVDKDDVIIVGHGRWMAYKKFPDGIKEPWIIKADDLTDEQVKAYRLADNKLNESDWDMGLALEELKGLSSEMFDLTGFDKDLLIEPDEKDDVIPENVPPQARLGDIYQLGNHRVMCGDSTQPEAVLRLMEGKKAELLFTSPPYSDMRDYEGGKDLSVGNLANFINVFSGYVKYQVINLGLQRKDNDIVEYWNEYIVNARQSGYKFLSWNVWNRETARTIGQQSAFFPVAHEWILVFGKDFKDINKTRAKADYTTKDKRKVKSRRQKDGSVKFSSVGDTSNPMTEMTSVFTSQPELNTAIRKTHPATFPVVFPQEYIRAISTEDDIVIDPFLGSGSTLIACEKTNRICYGMELDPKYVDVIIKRWEDYTGNKALKITN